MKPRDYEPKGKQMMRKRFGSRKTLGERKL
jgi:hypothetical protein